MVWRLRVVAWCVVWEHILAVRRLKLFLRVPLLQWRVLVAVHVASRLSHGLHVTKLACDAVC